MSPYCEADKDANSDSVRGRHEYELFSVVVHSGSTHSGHYTAIIRDVDQLGAWTHPVSGQDKITHTVYTCTCTCTLTFVHVHVHVHVHIYMYISYRCL